MPIENELQRVKERAEKQYRIEKDLPRNGRVIGIGVGPKMKADEVIDKNKKCLRFFVERKIRPKESVPEPFRINEEYQGVETDVIETGRIVSFQGRPGSSIGFDETDRDLPANVDPA